MDYVCAECGTTTATTYVVTIIDGDRTEVCRTCDSELRLRPLVESLLADEKLARPTTPDSEWERDDEEAELVADAYREAADLIASVI